MRGIITCVGLLVCASVSFGQREIDENSKPSWKERVYVGGGLGLNGGTDSYGNRYFYLGLYPVIGYMVTNKLSAGTGITWQYYSYPDVNQTINQYGFSPFVRYNISPAFLYAEYVILSSPTYTGVARKTYNRLLLGLGYSQPLGRRGALNVMGLYDVLYKREDLVFASPWVIRVYFSF